MANMQVGSWKELPVIGKTLAFYCPKCQEANRLEVSLFTTGSAAPANGITQTGEVIIKQGRPIWGYLVAFIVAFIIGGILATIVGKVAFWITATCAVIVLAGGKLFNNIFGKKLPVWITKCSNCSYETPVAVSLDGTSAAIGEIQGSSSE